MYWLDRIVIHRMWPVNDNDFTQNKLIIDFMVHHNVGNQIKGHVV